VLVATQQPAQLKGYEQLGTRADAAPVEGASRGVKVVQLRADDDWTVVRRTIKVQRPKAKV